jgi:hypothetical protein
LWNKKLGQKRFHSADVEPGEFKNVDRFLIFENVPDKTFVKHTQEIEGSTPHGSSGSSDHQPEKDCDCDGDAQQQF